MCLLSQHIFTLEHVPMQRIGKIACSLQPLKN